MLVSIKQLLNFGKFFFALLQIDPSFRQRMKCYKICTYVIQNFIWRKTMPGKLVKSWDKQDIDPNPFFFWHLLKRLTKGLKWERSLGKSACHFQYFTNEAGLNSSNGKLHHIAEMQKFSLIMNSTMEGRISLFCKHS